MGSIIFSKVTIAKFFKFPLSIWELSVHEKLWEGMRNPVKILLALGTGNNKGGLTGDIFSLWPKRGLQKGKF